MFTRIVDGEIVYEDRPPPAAARAMARARLPRTLGTPSVASVRSETIFEATTPGLHEELRVRAEEPTEEAEPDPPTCYDLMAWMVRWDRMLIAALWVLSLWLLVDVWPLWLLAFVLYSVWACSKHGKRTAEDGLSAYSVFNPGTTRIFGTVTAEELQAQASGMMLPLGRRQQEETADDVARRIAAQEQAQLEAVLQASLEEQ